jgi:N4-gp56 family major capsid protein
MSWQFNAPTGVYKNHALSTRLRHSAIADSHFFRFVSPEPGYGKGKGESITITRTGNLPLATRVNEDELLPSGQVPKSTVSKTVSEWGYTVPMTELEQNLTHFNLRNDTQRALRDQMRLTLDKMTADELKTTPIKAVSTAAATMTIQTTTFAGTATHNLSIDHLRILRDYFRATQLVSGFENGKYVGILSTHAARGIKNDSTYKDWLAPTTSGPLMDGRMRDVEGFALFETNNNDACTDQIASGKTGEAIFMAADPAFLAVVQDPELRAGLKTNLGRFQDLGWVGTLEAGLTWPEFADARVIHWGTA